MIRYSLTILLVNGETVSFPEVYEETLKQFVEMVDRNINGQLFTFIQGGNTIRVRARDVSMYTYRKLETQKGVVMRSFDSLATTHPSE